MKTMIKLHRSLMWGSVIVFGIIPFGCSQPLLRTVTPFLLDGNRNIIDNVIGFLAPLLLP